MKCIDYALLISSLLAVSSVSADTLTFTNNDHLTGTLVSIAGSKLLFKTQHLGTLNISIDQVASIARDKPITVRTDDREQLTGTLTSQDGQQIIETPAGSTVVNVEHIKRAFEDYLKVQEKRALTWQGRIDLGYNLTTGNSETQSLSLHGKASAKHGWWEHRLAGGIDKSQADNLTTKDLLNTSYELRWYYQKRWYALGNLSYFQDKIKEVDQRITVGAGFGHRFWDNSLGALSAEAGISQVFEALDEEDDSNPALRWAVDWNRWLRPETLEVFHHHEILKILTSDRGEILNASTGLRLHINDHWNAHVRVDVVRESEPLPGRHRTDASYVMGVGWLF